MLTIEDFTLDDFLIWEEHIWNSQQLFHQNLRVKKDEVLKILRDNISKIAKLKYLNIQIGIKLENNPPFVF